MKYKKNFYQIKNSEKIFDEIKKERDIIGYYSLPYQDITEIKFFAEKVIQTNVVVVGIGGSTLGTSAIYNFLKKKKSFKKELFFLESTDPIDLKDKINKIDLKDSIFLIISKSGTTIETISIFKYLSSLICMTNDNCVIISEEKSDLTKFAKKNKMKNFLIPENVGGRFSVFSSVGLVPLAIIGVDINLLLKGTRKINESFFNKKEYYYSLFEKARFMVENKNRFNINVLFSYSSSLEYFNKWYIQLWGESLGKYNINGTRQGLTPIGLIGPIDQHSFLQLITDGVRDKTVTFIKVEDFEDEVVIPPDSLNDFKKLKYINGLRFEDLINQQADATIKSISYLKDIPYDVITINKIDEYSISKLMYSYQLLTSIIGKFVQINTYNQPGVELGKKLLKESFIKD